jgi:hypothetical protein
MSRVGFREWCGRTSQFRKPRRFINGAGTFTLYLILTCGDGSKLGMKSVGTGTLDGTTTHFVSMVTGTRYRLPSVGTDLVSDYTIKSKLTDGIRIAFPPPYHPDLFLRWLKSLAELYWTQGHHGARFSQQLPAWPRQSGFRSSHSTS